jgi:hypothetical protein
MKKMKKTKKIVAILLCAAMCLTSLTACNNQEETPNPSDNTVQTTPAQEVPQADREAFEITIETLVVADEDIDRIDVKYLKVSGMENSEVQEMLNEELFIFCTWPTVNRDNDDKNITVAVQSNVIGDRFISVRAFDSIYAEDAAYPDNHLRAIVFDAETGEYAGDISEFMDVYALNAAANSFVQIFPEEPIDGAFEVLTEELDANDFYLTHDSVGVFVTGRPHAAGSYWIFEVKYDDVLPFLRQQILDALDTAYVPDGVRILNTTHEDDNAVIEYLYVMDMPDGEIQAKLNEYIKDFFLWQWLYAPDGEEPDDNYYRGTASFTLIGDRFLSVWRILDVYSDEHPVNGNSDNTPTRISAMTFDMTTGESVAELIYGGAAYTTANAFDKFVQTHPTTENAAAKAQLHDYLQSMDYIYGFFLKETTLAVFVFDDDETEYFIFEAPYEQIGEMLSQSLVDVLE